jgi:hypothetical protein
MSSSGSSFLGGAFEAFDSFVSKAIVAGAVHFFPGGACVRFGSLVDKAVAAPAR